jgi:hypothetical protein
MLTIVVVCLACLLGIIIGTVWMFWPRWNDYVSQEGNFGVVLPGKPDYHIHEAEVNGVPGKTTFHTMELDEGGIVYAVAYADLPKEVEPNKELLDKIGLANLAGVFSFKVDNQPGIETTFRNYPFPGKKYSFSVPFQGEAIVRVYLVHRRLYLIMACGEEISQETESVKRFMDSFDFYDTAEVKKNDPAEEKKKDSAGEKKPE